MGTADEADRNAFGYEPRKQVPKKFFAASPLPEIIYKQDLHGWSLCKDIDFGSCGHRIFLIPFLQNVSLFSILLFLISALCLNLSVVISHVPGWYR